MSIFVIIAMYSIFSIFEVISLLKDNKKKELVIFSCFMTAAFVLSLLLALDVDVPSVDTLVSDWVLSLLGE